MARRLAVSRAAIHQWYGIWKQKGRSGLRAVGRLGRKPNLTKRDIARIRKELLQGPRHAGSATAFWNLDRITTVIRPVASVSYHPSHVWKVLLPMGWSCQKPETPAKEREEKAIQHGVEVSWPRIPKKG